MHRTSGDPLHSSCRGRGKLSWGFGNRSEDPLHRGTQPELEVPDPWDVRPPVPVGRCWMHGRGGKAGRMDFLGTAGPGHRYEPLRRKFPHDPGHGGVAEAQGARRLGVIHPEGLGPHERQQLPRVAVEILQKPLAVGLCLRCRPQPAIANDRLGRRQAAEMVNHGGHVNAEVARNLRRGGRPPIREKGKDRLRVIRRLGHGHRA